MKLFISLFFILVASLSNAQQVNVLERSNTEHWIAVSGVVGELNGYGPKFCSMMYVDNVLNKSISFVIYPLSGFTPIVIYLESVEPIFNNTTDYALGIKPENTTGVIINTTNGSNNPNLFSTTMPEQWYSEEEGLKRLIREIYSIGNVSITLDNRLFLDISEEHKTEMSEAFKSFVSYCDAARRHNVFVPRQR